MKNKKIYGVIILIAVLAVLIVIAGLFLIFDEGDTAQEAKDSGKNLQTESTDKRKDEETGTVEADEQIENEDAQKEALEEPEVIITPGGGTLSTGGTNQSGRNKPNGNTSGGSDTSSDSGGNSQPESPGDQTQQSGNDDSRQPGQTEPSGGDTDTPEQPSGPADDGVVELPFVPVD